MIIKVIYVNDGLRLVNAAFLDDFIKTRRIIAFERASGWVTIGRDPIRQKKRPFAGPDRRSVEQY